MKSYKTILPILMSAVLFSCNNGPKGQEGGGDVSMPVQIKELTKSSIKKFTTTTGTIYANGKVDIASEMSGKYKPAINPRTGKTFKMGDIVKKGDLLVEFENKEYELTQSVDLKKREKENAEQDLQKQKNLLEKGGATLINIRDAETRIANAENSYQAALLQLAKMKVYSPIDGVIVDREHYTEDVTLEAGKPLFTVMEYGKMYVDVFLPESVLPMIKTGQETFITHYTLPGDTIPATIAQISPAINSQTRTFKGVIEVENKDLKIRPGMFVKCNIVVNSAQGVIVIPKQVVTNSGGRYSVFKIENNVAKYCIIQVGMEDDTNIEVMGGLNEGDNLVIRGYETLRHDSKVKILK